MFHITESITQISLKKIRVVFDCSARFNGVSLNKSLMSGPDLTNQIVGVITRFREESVVIMGDIEASSRIVVG